MAVMGVFQHLMRISFLCCVGEWSPVFLSKWHPSVQILPLGLAILPVNIKEEVQDQSCLVFGLGWVDFVCSQFRNVNGFCPPLST
ncbi:hypothetical protein Peur_063449 [Populus x canadensis]